MTSFLRGLSVGGDAPFVGGANGSFFAENKYLNKVVLKYAIAQPGSSLKKKFARSAPAFHVMCDETTITHKATKHKSSGLLKVDLIWGGQDIEFAGVYAPAKALERVNFFQTLRNNINKKNNNRRGLELCTRCHTRHTKCQPPIL